MSRDYTGTVPVSSGGSVSHDSIEFDPFSDTFFDDPYETYARLRDEAPVYFNEKYGFYALSRHADVVAAHGDPVRFVSSYGITLELLLQKQPMHTNMMIVMDPPEHTRQRKLVSQAFSRNAIGSLEPLIAEVIAGYLDQLSGRKEFDLVAEFAALFPVEVISTILGVPAGSANRCACGSIRSCTVKRAIRTPPRRGWKPLSIWPDTSWIWPGSSDESPTGSSSPS